MLSINLINLTVIVVVLILCLLVIIHLVRVYRKSPCGDCASAKECQVFSKNKLLKAYKKACKKENNVEMRN